MNPDRRRSPRHAVQALVYLHFNVGELPALMLDVSEQGLALQAPEPLPSAQEVPLRFVLPGTAAQRGSYRTDYLVQTKMVARECSSRVSLRHHGNI